MEYCKEIIYMKKLIDSVLIDLKQKPLDENSDFILDPNWNENHYIIIRFKKPNNISIKFEISYTDFVIYIDRTEESYGWNYKFIKEHEEYIAGMIKAILTETIRVEYCGENYTKIYFIDDEGTTTNTLTYRFSLLSLFVFRWNCWVWNHTEKIYDPIYELPVSEVEPNSLKNK